MLDPKLIENDLDFVRNNLAKRGDKYRQDLERLTKLYNIRRGKIIARDDLNAKKKIYADAYVELRKDGAIDDAEIIRIKAEENKDLVRIANNEVDSIEERIRLAALQLPNILHPDVPEGKDEDSNRIIRRSHHSPYALNKKYHFPKHTREHVDIAAELLDFGRAAKLSGRGFAVLRGQLAKLERAIGQFFLDYHTEINGYEEVAVPYIVDGKMMEGTGQLPKFEEDMYLTTAGTCDQDPGYLIPTAEVPLTNLYRDEIITEDFLPIKMTALTPCFRSEAGSHGQESRGLIRQHQFNKVELVQIVMPEDAERAHKELLGDAELMLQALELPYRVVLLCAGDTSFAAHKCYDIEVWLPSQGRYREISSVSQFGDFQARRANIKYKTKSKKKGYVHTLNGSGLAVGRTLVAILENNLQKDGTVKIPEVLVPYTKFESIDFCNGINL